MWLLSRLQSAPVYNPTDPKNQAGLSTQLVLSLLVGIASFISFCILRPRWSTLYAARRKQMSAARTPPELPKTFLGWIPALWRITQDDILLYAGLDAYVFLTFFRMAIKLLIVFFFFTLVVINPVHLRFHDKLPELNSTSVYRFEDSPFRLKPSEPAPRPGNYLWMYVVFVYVFTFYTMWLLTTETTKIITVRQQYLASQATVTDRTIRLSGIPKDLRAEDKITTFIEELEIGKVVSVTLCRDWSEIDGLVEQRATTLRRLEEAHVVLRLRARKAKETTHVADPNLDGDEESNLLNGVSSGDPDLKRPTIRIWQSKFSMNYKKIDAVHYFEEKLRRLDEAIEEARKKEYKPTGLAFVTLDSVAACQMAVQAILDPSPRLLLAHPSPAPQDVVWRNTYTPRWKRMLSSWSVTVFILILTVLWIIPVSALAGFLTPDNIEKALPSFSRFLDRNPVVRDLVLTSIPTIIIATLNVLVPYLYEWLSNFQGMVSQSDVDLSVISKNFFFTFFNVFIVFTVFQTATGLYDVIRDSFKDLTKIAKLFAFLLQGTSRFYTNFIILQALGLFPLRLLEFGSVFLYPFGYLGSKTPRDRKELDAAPIFTYGFYLPQSLFVVILCIIYSIFRDGYLIIGFGLIYFVLGYFIYKYQLLYAMEHSQHSTGRAWPIICYRIILGLVCLQIAVGGFLLGLVAFTRAALMLPILIGTLWFSSYYRKSYEPLTKFIALRGIHKGLRQGPDDVEVEIPTDTIEEVREKQDKFVNPSLYMPLEPVWVRDLEDDLEADLEDQTQSQPSSTDRPTREATPTSSALSNPWAD